MTFLLQVQCLVNRKSKSKEGQAHCLVHIRMSGYFYSTYETAKNKNAYTKPTTSPPQAKPHGGTFAIDGKKQDQVGWLVWSRKNRGRHGGHDPLPQELKQTYLRQIPASRKKCQERKLSPEWSICRKRVLVETNSNWKRLSRESVLVHP